MIQREIGTKVLELAGQYPILSITGPRQSGKTTLVRELFPDYTYISFENPDALDRFNDDPITFMRRHGDGVIFDEAQRAPRLFSYLQEAADEIDVPGRYVLSGSQNFLLMKSVSQSLAGRVALFTLPPLSYAELRDSDNEPPTMLDWLFRGGYPRLFNGVKDPLDFFPDYVQTYLERDIRTELGVRKVADFRRFLQLCALRCGELLNVASLASDCGITAPTAREWLSLLEASHIVVLLRPYAANRTKRLVKSPKLYFLDTGLASYLMGAESPEDIFDCGYQGQLFENAVIAEVIKREYARKRVPRISFWRDDHKREIDLIIEKGNRVARAVECKSSATYNSRFFDVLTRVSETDLPVDISSRCVVYGGDEHLSTNRGEVIPYRSVGTLVGLD